MVNCKTHGEEKEACAECLGLARVELKEAQRTLDDIHLFAESLRTASPGLSYEAIADSIDAHLGRIPPLFGVGHVVPEE